MKHIAQNFASLFTSKKTYYILLLFIYFGFMTIPEWFYRFSSLSLIWLLFSPIVATALVVIGIWGIIGFLQSKVNKGQVISKYISFIQISITGLLAFGISIAIANQTYFLYQHQKFNSEIWQDPNSISNIGMELTQRQRMLDDVVENILPGKNKDEIEALLGKSLYGNNRSLQYILGPERSLISIDPELIVIWLDDTGNFERYEVHGS
jgi:hypothetical protein